MAGDRKADGRLVLFVCTANQCRSPMAEYLLRHRLELDGIPWKVASAGTSAIPGFEASSYAVGALTEMGIDMSGHRSSPLSDELVGSSEVILGMTRLHVEEIIARYPVSRDKVFLLTSFREPGVSPNVEDPVGMSLDVYRSIRDSIDAELPYVIQFLQKC